MLTFKMVDDNILEVKETVHRLKSTEIRYFYYDIKNWKMSSFGREGDVLDRDMTESDIEWVKKYYLPKVNK